MGQILSMGRVTLLCLRESRRSAGQLTRGCSGPVASLGAAEPQGRSVGAVLNKESVLDRIRAWPKLRRSFR